MTRSRSQAHSGATLSLQLVRTLREGALWVFGALALILWYALFTYDISDAGFSQASSSGTIQNGVGRFGALIADLLFNFFGRPAYLFVLLVFYLGWMIYREQRTQEVLTRADFGWRVGGFLATK
jgi:S-DNA-T family DNA segregation ATPase FtsK/SpoIIIE